MKLLALTAAILVAFIVVGCGDDDDATDSSTGTTTPSASASADVSASPTGGAPGTDKPSDSPLPTSSLGVCQENPAPAAPDITQVTDPDAGDEVTSPLTVEGNIVAFEAQFSIALKDADGNDITTVVGNSEEGQVLSPYSEQVIFSVERETDACLWVYDESGADGSPINVVQVPLKLEP